MPIAAQCPNCGGPLSETSVLALAPVCERCGTVITKIGGTLGLTSAYGVNDPTITRERVEADLAVFCDHRTKSERMLEAHKEQLTWGVERYAKLPIPPEYLSLVTPPEFDGTGCLGCLFGLPLVIAGIVLPFVVVFKHGELATDVFALILLEIMGLSIFYGFSIGPYVKVWKANGSRPIENARRKKAYEEARAEALKAAEPIKKAQDYRLTVQIRELDGLIKTYTEKEEEIRGILQTL